MDTNTDGHLINYIEALKQDPSKKLWWLQVKKSDVEAVDYLVKICGGHRESVKTAKDWEVVTTICDFFAKRWPEEFIEFKSTVPDIRHTRRSGGKSTLGTIYLGALPPRLMKLLGIVFTKIQWNRTFVDNLLRKVPLLKIAGENNWG